MKGARIGPYEFQAIWHSAKGDVPVTLIIDTDIKYYDRHGHQITTNDLKPTVRIKEVFSSIEIDSPKK
jgi:hypothetical protein